MSGKVKALVPINGLLLFSVNKVGLDSAGNIARALDGTDGDPPTVPDRLRADGDCWKLVVADGLICHVLGGTGGVSGPQPDVDRRRLPDVFDGGVPMANCTLGGDIELMSQLQLLLLRRFDCFMLMGCDRGIPLDAVAVLCEKEIFLIVASSNRKGWHLLWEAIGVERFYETMERASAPKSEACRDAVD